MANDTLTYTIHIAASLEQLWAAITSPEYTRGGSCAPSWLPGGCGSWPLRPTGVDWRDDAAARGQDNAVVEDTRLRERGRGPSATRFCCRKA